jgi:hypothetical protein
MSRHRIVAGLMLAALVLSSYSLRADVRADEKSRVEFAGALGRIVNIFGGKAAREGTASTVAVKGDRKATLTESTGQIVDLAEEKIYDLDMKKKSYKVTTFAELRRRMAEARAKAEKDAQKEQKEQGKRADAAPAPSESNVEIDFDVKDTGQKKTINGFDTHEVVMTIAVREKGKTLDQSGGLVVAGDTWLAPKIAAMNDIAAFDMRYAQKLYGPMVVGASAEEMAAALAMFPLLAPAIARLRTEGAKMEGTAILTVVTFDAVKSADQMAAEQKEREEDDKASPSGGVSGILGGLAKRAAKKKMEGDVKPRSTIMTSTTEVLKVVTDVAAADVAIPAGFKENK